MSFGFSIGDFIAVGKLALSVYRSCRDAPDSFSNISMEVLSLHAVLTEVEEIVVAQDMSPTRQNNLTVISQGCEGVLKDLQALVLRYESLGTQSKRTWDRMKWGMNDIAELRSRLTSNTVLLTAFLSTFQVVVEQKLNKLAREFQEGKHEGSVISTITVASLSQHDQDMWREIRKEFENIGISVAAFEANKAFIFAWVQNAMMSGAFMESKTFALEDTESEAESIRSFHSFHATTHDEGTKLPTNPPEFEDSELPSFLESRTKAQKTETSKRQNPQGAVDKPLSPPNQGSTAITQSIETLPKKKPRIISLLNWMLRYNKAFRDAVDSGDFVEAQKYLSKGADINAEMVRKDKEPPDTALYAAIKTSNIPTVKWLLEHGADWGRSNSLLPRVFTHCSGQPMFQIAQLLLDYGADINGERSFERNGIQKSRSALFIAIGKSDLRAVDWLLDHGADFHIQQLIKHSRGVIKEPPFHYAVSRSDFISTGIAQLLLDRGESVDIRNQDAFTALHVAVAENRSRLVAWLLDRNAQVDAKDHFSRTPLFHAVLQNNRNMAELLLERGASANARDGTISVIRTALLSGLDSLGFLLLEKGAEIQDFDAYGNSLLHAAVRGDCFRSFNRLLILGLDRNARNNLGELPSDKATRTIEGMKYLLQEAEEPIFSWQSEV